MALNSSLRVGLVLFALTMGTMHTAPASAADKEQTPAVVTSFGDGITMTEFPNQSGFETVGGGAKFTYDYQTKTLIMVEGGNRTVANFQNQPNQP